MYIVYMHENIANNKRYIGITRTNPQVRWGRNGYNYRRNVLFYRAINKYGWNTFKHEILYTHLTKEEACKIEQELISNYKTTNPKYGYNIGLGGEGTSSVSEETKRKISEKNKGRKAWNKGKHNIYSEETKKKMGASRSKIVICLETNIEYPSVLEATRQTNIDDSSINLVCLGRRKTAGGYHWQYKD